MNDVFKGIGPQDSGMLKFMDITGRRLHEMGFKKGKLISYGKIVSKEPKESISNNIYTCTEWFLVTTFYGDYGEVLYVTTESLGITCTNDCNNGDLGNLCQGGGGGMDGGGDQIWEIDINSSSSVTGNYEIGSPSYPGTEPPIEILYTARKKMKISNGVIYTEYVDVHPIFIALASQEVTFVASNGTLVWRSAYIVGQNNSWEVLVQPTVWIQWTGALNTDYVWFGGSEKQIKPLRHVKIE
jgi:hypothetical protein